VSVARFNAAFDLVLDTVIILAAVAIVSCGCLPMHGNPTCVAASPCAGCVSFVRHEDPKCLVSPEACAWADVPDAGPQ
jgi:hypothetical protein